MLSHIDRELFSDRCEVVVFNDPQRYVYPIFKNGSSALSRHAKRNKLTRLLNQQISRVDAVEIYLRDPLERFVSGINTFCQMTLRDHPHLDDHTVTWFAERYLFLNRHYATQFSWIVNLARYASKECKFSLRNVQQLKSFLGTAEPEGIGPVKEPQRGRISQNRDLEMYLRLDQSLIDLTGQDITWDQICKQMKQNDTAAWDYVVTQNLDILGKCTVLG